MITLHPFQDTIVTDLREAFKRFLSVLLVSPTGSGKTVMFSYLASRIASKSQRIIILVHREELLQQVSETLTQFNVPHGLIAAGEPYDRRYAVHVASVFTLVRRLDKIQIPDWCITDECHHCVGGSTWGKVIAHWRSIKPKMRLLGVTATPCRLSGEGLGVQADGPFEHMVLGPTPRQLMDRGFLSDYRLIVPPAILDRSMLHTRAGEYIAGEVDAQISKAQITGDVISQYKKLCDGLPSVLFAPSVESAEMFASRFRNAGYQAISVDGKLDKQLRRAIVDDFRRGALQLLMSCQLVDEGFDVKGIYGAIDVSPTQSLSRCLQRWGRALRTAEGKDKAIIIDHVGNSGSMDNGQFVPKHGLPDDEREWTLDGAPKKKANEPSAPAPRQCGYCFAMSKAFSTQCVECGKPFEVKSREVKEVEGELIEVDPSIAKRQARIEQGMTKDLDSLIKLGIHKYGAVKGPRWARHVWDGRQAKLAKQQAQHAEEMF